MPNKSLDARVIMTSINAVNEGLIIGRTIKKFISQTIANIVKLLSMIPVEPYFSIAGLNMVAVKAIANNTESMR